MVKVNRGVELEMRPVNVAGCSSGMPGMQKRAKSRRGGRRGKQWYYINQSKAKKFIYWMGWEWRAQNLLQRKGGSAWICRERLHDEGNK